MGMARVLNFRENEKRKPLEFNLEYIQLLSAGDPATERHFACHFSGVLRIRLRSRFRDEAQAEDVSQETLYRVLRTIRREPCSIDHPERLGPFVNSVCTHVMLEGFRRESRYQGVREEDLQVADPTLSVEGSLLSLERQQMVRRLLEELPAKDRSVLTEVFLEERDKDEICEIHHVDRDYLRVLLFRACTRFRTLLAKERS